MIFITGATGFIGAHLHSFLAKQGHRVVGLDIKTSCPSTLAKQDEFYQISVAEKSKVEGLFQKYRPQVVLHLGMTSTPKDAVTHPQMAEDSIIQGTSNLLELSNQFNVQKFVFFSSSHVYGDVAVEAVSEDLAGKVKSHYGKLKQRAEELCWQKSQGKNLSCSIIRPTSVYGPHDPAMRVINKFIDKALCNEPITINNTKSKLDFTYIDDFIKGVELVMKNQKEQVYNISRGRGRTLPEAAEILKKHFPQLEIILNEDSHLNETKKGCLDISRAQKELGFNPTIDLEEGILRILQEIGK